MCVGINSDSPCCLFETLFYILSVIYLPAIFLLTLFSIIFYSIAQRNSYSYREDNFTAFCFLLPTVIGYLIAVVCFGYTVIYMLKFTRLVERNFNLVPRNRVFSNMIYVRTSSITNKYLEISGHLAAALRKNELSYDQIND